MPLLPARLRDPAARNAFRLTIALWTFGYLLLLALVGARAGLASGNYLALLAGQYLCALTIASALLTVVVGTAGKRWHVARVAVAFLACVALQGFIDFLTNWLFDQTFVPNIYDRVPLTLYHYFRGTFLFFWVFGINLVLIYLALAHGRNAAQAAALAKAEQAATEAQLVMLRYQLNPHFLFNTLNAISSLVVTHRNREAEEMLGRLSEFLRATLVATPGGFAPLDAELAVTEEYLELEAVRFGERLQVEYDVATDAAAVLVPSFILQPLVENAIKYAVAPSRSPVTVRIEAALDGGDLVVGVRDDGGESGAVRGGTGVGLSNVRARLQATYGARASLIAERGAAGFAAVIRLPAQRAPVPAEVIAA